MATGMVIAWLAACGGRSEPNDGILDAGIDANTACAKSAMPNQVVRISPMLSFENEVLDIAAAVNDHGTGVIAWGEQRRVLAARIANGCWDEPAMLGIDAVAEHAIIDVDGNATVVWTQRELDAQRNPMGSSLWATRYQDGNWQPAQRINVTPSPSDARYVFAPTAVLDGERDVVVVWIQDGERDTISWNRFTKSGWSGPTAIKSDVINASETIVAIPVAGKPVVIWKETSPNINAPTNVFSTRWTGTDWTASQLIGDPTLAGNDFAEFLHFVSRGNAGATAIWTQHKSSVTSFLQNHYDAALEAWSGPAALPPVPSTAFNLKLAGSQSRLAAAWSVPDAGIQNAWAARFTTNDGWSEAIALEASDSSAHEPAIGIDDRGHTLAIWEQPLPQQPLTALWASRAQPAGSFRSAQQLLSNGREASIATSPSGHTLVALLGRDPAFAFAVWAVLSPPES